MHCVLQRTAEEQHDLQDLSGQYVLLCRGYVHSLQLVFSGHKMYLIVPELLSTIVYLVFICFVSGGCPKKKVTYSKDMEKETRRNFACFSPFVNYGEFIPLTQILSYL